ncbi:hypothetical protein X975_22053, partial [Stegodyphus mimosarum]
MLRMKYLEFVFASKTVLSLFQVIVIGAWPDASHFKVALNPSFIARL